MNAQSDFADWYSPMLVKELRQGMRSRLFVISFLLLQGALIFVAAIGLSASAKQQDTSVVTGFFWTIIGVPLLLIMPMSGLNAVVNERKANTLELMFLTRLTPRRIIIGKWLAIVAQTVLLVCTVLPYSVLRYFQGGVNIGAELFTIGALLIGSVLLSGVFVGFSPHSSRLTRALLILLAVVFLQTIPRLLFARVLVGPSPTSGPGSDWRIYGTLAWFGLLVLLIMVEVGASRISPLAENHSTSRRILGLLALTVFVVYGARDFAQSLLFTCTAIVLAGVCIGALCEAPRFVPSMYRPFTKFGRLGRLSGLVLYPGWPTGVFYCLVVVLAMTLVGLRQENVVVDPHWVIWGGVSVAGTLLFPAAILRTFVPRARRPFFVYLGVQTVLALMVGFAASVQAYGGTDLRQILAVIPTCGLLLSANSLVTDGNYYASLIGMSVVTAGSVVLLLVKMKKPWREIRKAERAAVQLPSEIVVDAANVAATQ